ncbi:MAG: hypothetical protein AAGI63_03850 [Planctomycetota bacterium]
MSTYDSTPAGNPAKIEPQDFSGLDLSRVRHAISQICLRMAAALGSDCREYINEIDGILDIQPDGRDSNDTNCTSDNASYVVLKQRDFQAFALLCC